MTDHNDDRRYWGCISDDPPPPRVSPWLIWAGVTACALALLAMGVMG